MSTGTCLQDSWIQIIQVDIEGAKEIITRLQSGFYSIGQKTRRIRQSKFTQCLERSRAEFYVYAVRPRHSRTEIERIKKAPGLYDLWEGQGN